ncbi:serine/threonine-protein kinase ULK3-like isoform X2 [Daphnia carinata]|uniref:serine/threonine-protein kinase ULK3-like isoform X2 n=1 Tax=Daphnia carinata TaxID=120202 RepID=UPI00257B78A6|nr:serine/threonine-protein kinase ULK3-like isoform X2 [Daphnia carinata]
MPLPRIPGFILITKIGSGTFSEVYKAYRFVNNSKQVVAVKCIVKNELSANTVDNIIHEIEALKLLRHPHIIQMIDFSWDENFIYIIMEYCEGGDLSVFVRSHKQLQEKICKSFLCQLASALQYLRQHNIVHMDLKPSNLLLTSRRNPILKLADFGLAQSLKNRQRETSFRGSPLYMAPEILRRESYDASVDLWSTGVILYECLFGKPPCSSSSLKELVENIQSKAAITIPTTKDISADCRDLLERLLQKDPNKRMTYEEFFNHPFVRASVASCNVAETEAKLVFERAQNMDKWNRRGEAVTLYRQAQTLLNRLISADVATVRDAQIRKRLDVCSRRIQEIESSENVLKQNTLSAEAPLSRDWRANMSPTFQELQSLSSTTPDLLSALEIGLEGVQYDGEGQHAVALERYKAALEKLIPLLRSESKGRRRELLRLQITLWMDRAEQLQTFHDLHQSNVEELQSGDASGYCSLQ